MKKSIETSFVIEIILWKNIETYWDTKHFIHIYVIRFYNYLNWTVFMKRQDYKLLNILVKSVWIFNII